jgi:hypothetical protein
VTERETEREERERKRKREKERKRERERERERGVYEEHVRCGSSFLSRQPAIGQSR